MPQAIISVEFHVGDLLKKIEEMRTYLHQKGADSNCPFVAVATEIGEIDMDECVAFETVRTRSGWRMSARPTGDLCKLIAVFQAVQQ